MSPKLSAKNRFPSVPEAELQKLRNIWIGLWKEHGEPAGGMAELWYHAVIRFLEERGDQIFSKEQLRAEERLIHEGLSVEFYSSLSNVVSPDLSGAADEYERVIELVRATPEERALAVREILSGSASRG